MRWKPTTDPALEVPVGVGQGNSSKRGKKDKEATGAPERKETQVGPDRWVGSVWRGGTGVPNLDRKGGEGLPGKHPCPPTPNQKP